MVSQVRKVVVGSEVLSEYRERTERRETEVIGGVTEIREKQVLVETQASGKRRGQSL